MTRFVQLADTHLDSYISSTMRLSKDKADALMNDLRTAFARGCALAAERSADLVLIPGDLFDYETATADTIAFIHRTLAGIAPIPVFIAPGNHDSLRAGSAYHQQWPANVHVFTAPEFQSVHVGSYCSVTGIAHAHRGITERVLSRPISRPDCQIQILLFHGSRDGYPSDKDTVIPFSDAEVIAQGFTYTAIGHYHSYAEIRDEKSIRAAYSGCAQGRGLDETGRKCVLVGEITPEGIVELEQVEVAERMIVRVDVDITGSRDNTEILARMDAAAENQARPCDVVCVYLRGRLAPGVAEDTAGWASAQPYFAATVNDSAVEPDYDLEELGRESAASSIRSVFIRKMLERQERAACEDDKRAARDAIYYGLSALDGRKLEPRDAD